MQFNLHQKLPTPGPLPAGYRLLAWRDELVHWHARAKFASFRHELDAIVFPSLSTDGGCRQLMHDIAKQSNFLPEATWLIVHQPPDSKSPQPIATVQGIREPEKIGSIQNVGVAPEHRGRGLGRTLLVHSLRGFQLTGHSAVYLEVTGKNTAALRLYQRFGFEIQRTVYRSLEIVDN